MKNNIVLTIVMSITLFVLSFYQYDKVWDFLMNSFEPESIIIKEMNTQFMSNLNFALCIAIIPFFAFVISKLIKKNGWKEQISVLFFLVVSEVVGFFIRLSLIKSELSWQKGNTSMDMKDLHIERYMFLGALLGSVLVILIFRFIILFSKTVKN